MVKISVVSRSGFRLKLKKMAQDKVLNVAIKMIKKQNKTERDRIKKLVNFHVKRERSGGGRNS